MNRSWLKTAAVVLPVITVVLFGLSGGWIRIYPWISGAAIGCAEAAIIVIFLLISSSTRVTPFYIATGTITGIYVISVIVEVILFGYLLELPESTYLLIHLITIIAFVVITGLIALAAKYTANQERREHRKLDSRSETVNRLASIRMALQSIPDIPQIDDSIEQIRKLEEVFRYSDPILDPSLYEIEQLIQQKISILEDQVNLVAIVPAGQRKEQTAEAIRLVRDTLTTVQDRNAQLLKAKTGST